MFLPARWFSRVLVLGVLAAASPLHAATIGVNSSADVAADDGQCTLREAIVAANANLPSGAMAGECAAGEMAGLDTITFAIPGEGPHAIFVFDALPVIAGPVLLDGWSQPGASPNTIAALDGYDAVHMVRIDGSQSSNVSKPGLSLQGPAASGSTIRGLEIAGFTSTGCCADNGIYLSGTTVGVVLSGNIIRNHRSRGVLTLSQGGSHSGLRIGGPQPEDRNLIHSNTSGPGISLNGCMTCVVQNNWIGIRPEDGIPVAGPNQIGVDLNSGSDGSVMRDNWIGGNSQFGVTVRGETSLLELHDNLIGGNIGNARGLQVSNTNLSFPTDTLVRANRITGNAQTGVTILNSSPGTAVQRHVLRGNRLFGNGGLELDLGANGGGADGVTPNDADDTDTGPNGLQNFPVLGAPMVADGSLTLPYSLAAPAGDYALEFSFSSECDASGHGPAGSMEHDPIRLELQPAAGDAVLALPDIPVAGFVSATATGPEGSSEFSACVPYVYQTVVFGNGFEDMP